MVVGRWAMVCLVHGQLTMTDYRLVPDDHRLSTITKVILAVLTFGMAGLLAELALIAHYEDATQWIPLALLAVGLVVVAADVAFSSRWTQLVIQMTMVLMIAAGVLGVYFHFNGSREFQVEMDPADARHHIWCGTCCARSRRRPWRQGRWCS